MRFEPDAFATSLARIEREAGGFTNVCRTNALLGSAVAFFGAELVQIKPVDLFLRTKLPAATCARLPALLRKLEADDLFAPLKDFCDLGTAPGDLAHQFEIPETPRTDPAGTTGAEMAAGVQFFLLHSDEFLPARSWPWTLTRELAFLLRGQQEFLSSDILDLYNSNDTGPVGCLVAAQLLHSQNSTAAKAMAARGLERLSSDDFLRDCRLFFDESKICGRLAPALAATLRNFNGQELDALTKPMPAPSSDFIRDCVSRLRAVNRNRPLFETLAPALEAFWASELKQNTADKLKQIASE